MFRRVASSSLRRHIHTSSARTPGSTTFPRLGFALGASTVVATYLTLRLTLDSERVALDGPNDNSRSAQPPQTDFRYPTFSQPRHVEGAPKVAPPSSEPVFLPDDNEQTPEPALKDSDVSSQETPTSTETTTAAGEEGSDHTAGGGGAYDPVTGEINWDCPCLGGMAQGPCGEQFKEAFSCFVYSEEEPKGINCVEKFKAMQNCFREHPEIYAEEIMDDDDEPEGVAIAESAAADEVRPPPESDKYDKPVEHISASAPADTSESTSPSSPSPSQ